MVYLRTVFALIACQERRRRYPQEYNTKGKGPHGRRATPATVRAEPGGVRTLEAPGGVSPIYPRVPRLPPRDRIALAILRPLRDTVGHALPRLRHQAASRPGLAAQPRAQQLNETQRQLDQLKLEQQLHRVQHELQLNHIEREHNRF